MSGKRPSMPLKDMIEKGLLPNGALLRYTVKDRIMGIGIARPGGIQVPGVAGLHSAGRFEELCSSRLHRPNQHILTSNGKSLQEIAVNYVQSASRGTPAPVAAHSTAAFAARPGSPEPGPLMEARNDSVCWVCHAEGDLMCCVSCPAAAHAACFGLEEAPAGDWHCPLCSCTACGHAHFEGLAGPADVQQVEWVPVPDRATTGGVSSSFQSHADFARVKPLVAAPDPAGQPEVLPAPGCDGPSQTGFKNRHGGPPAAQPGPAISHPEPDVGKQMQLALDSLLPMASKASSVAVLKGGLDVCTRDTESGSGHLQPLFHALLPGHRWQGRDQALQAMSAFLWRFKTMFPGSTLDVGGMTPAAARALATIAPHQAAPQAAQDLAAQQHTAPQPQQPPAASAAGLPLGTPSGPATAQPLHSPAQQALPQAAHSAQAPDAIVREAAMAPSAQPGRPAFLPGKARLNPQTTAAPWPPAQLVDQPPGDSRSLKRTTGPQQLHQPSHGTVTDTSTAALPSNETRLEAAIATPTAALQPAAAAGLSGRGQVAQGLQHMHLEQPSPCMAAGSAADEPLPTVAHSAPTPILPAGNPSNLVRQPAGAANPLPRPQSAAAQHHPLSAAALKETARAAPGLKLGPTEAQPHMLGAPSRAPTQTWPPGRQHDMLPAAATAKALEAAAAALSPQPAVAAAAPVARDRSPEGWEAALVQCCLSGLRYHLGCLRAPAQEVVRRGRPWCRTAVHHMISAGLATLCAQGLMSCGTLGDGTPIHWQLICGAAVSAPQMQTCRGFAPRHTAEQQQGLRQALAAARFVLGECFSRLWDSRLGVDLVPWMLQGKCSPDRRLDFSGFHTAVLWAGGTVVSVGSLRVFGPELAEVDLLATRQELQGNGLAHILQQALESALLALGVRLVAMPALPQKLGGPAHQQPAARGPRGAIAPATAPEAVELDGTGASAGLAAGASPGRLQPQHASAASCTLQAADQGQEQPQGQLQPWGSRTGYRAATPQEARLVASLPALQLPGVPHLVKGLSRDTLTQVRLPVSGLKALDPEVTEHSLVSGLLYSIRQQPQLKGSPPKAKLQPKPVVRSARQQARRAQHPASLPAGDQDVTMDISNGA